MGGGKRSSLLQILSPPQYIVPLPSIACFPSVLFCAYLGLRSRSVNKLTEQRNWRTGLGGCTTKKRQRQLRLFGLRCHCSEIRLSVVNFVGGPNRPSMPMTSTTVVTKWHKRGDVCSDSDEQWLGGCAEKRTRRGESERREARIPPSRRKVAEFRGR